MWSFPEGVERSNLSWLTDTGGNLSRDAVGASVIYKQSDGWHFGLLLRVSKRGRMFCASWFDDEDYDQRLAHILSDRGMPIDVVVPAKGKEPSFFIFEDA